MRRPLLFAFSSAAEAAEREHVGDFALWKSAVGVPLVAKFESLPCKECPRCISNFEVILKTSLVDAGAESRRFWDDKLDFGSASLTTMEPGKRHLIDQYGDRGSTKKKDKTAHEERIKAILKSFEAKVNCTDLSQ